MGGVRAASGELVNAENVFGIPAAVAAIRLVSEAIASLPIGIYRGKGADKELIEDAWQNDLLNHFGNYNQSPYELMVDIAGGVEGYGNAYLQKIKSRKSGKITELIPVDPNTVRVTLNDAGEKEFLVWVAGERKTYSTSQILQIRGYTPKGGLEGFSPIQVHRNALGNALAIQRYAGSLFANGAAAPFAIAVPGTLARRQAQEVLEIWNDSHQGLSNIGRPAILSNGATIEHIGMSLVDAEYIAFAKFTIQEIARIYRVPGSLIGAEAERGTAMTAEQEGIRFLQFSLLPRIRRIEQALHTDPDLFPPGGPEYPLFKTAELLRADALSQAQALQFLVQSGTLLRDEARADLGYGPLPGGVGQIPVVTPVGAGANPDPIPGPPKDTGDQDNTTS